MKKNDLISVLITAVLGLLAGSYLYVTSFAEILNRVFMPDADSVSEMTVVGDIYGGCKDSCPSFQVMKDGSYHYVRPAMDRFDRVKKEGDLPFSLRMRLKSSINIDELERQSKKLESTVCNLDTDTNEAKYRITLNGESYVLDSCRTKVDKGSKLWGTMRDLWEYFQTGNK